LIEFLVNEETHCPLTVQLLLDCFQLALSIQKYIRSVNIYLYIQVYYTL